MRRVRCETDLHTCDGAQAHSEQLAAKRSDCQATKHSVGGRLAVVVLVVVVGRQAAGE